MIDTRKIHIPGEVKDGIQRCTRCHTRLNRPPYDDSKLAVGVPVAFSRRGASVVRDAALLAEIRPCGKRG